eukprot:GILK01000920.1.p1 GENE.GILK01000920.1~~GILK01000920.1.p1  ORF type:complete len:802 (+),score=131.68 GILK01000920.1:64-2406(+)
MAAQEGTLRVSLRLASLFVGVFCGMLAIRSLSDSANASFSRRLTPLDPDPLCGSSTSTLPSYSYNAGQQALSFVKTMRGGDQQLVPVVQSGKGNVDMMDYAMSLMYWGGPFLALFVLSFFGWFSYCCCVFCCGAKKKKITEAQVRSNCFKLIPSLFYAFFACAIIVFSALGFTYEQQVSDGVGDLACGIVTFFNELNNGTTAMPHNSLSEAASNMTSIYNEYDNAKNNVSSLASASNSTFIQYGLRDIVNPINTFISDTNGKTFTHPSGNVPCTLCTTLATSMTTANTSITTNLGPTVTNLQSAYIGLVNQLSDSTVKTLVQTGADAVNSVITQVNELRDNFKNQYNSNIKYREYVNSGFIAIFAVFIGGAFIGAIAILLAGLLRMRKFTAMTHFSWCTLQLVTVIGLLFAGIFLPIGIVLSETCSALNTVIDPTNVNVTDTINGINAASATAIKTCILGNGNIQTAFGMNQALDFGYVYDQLNQINTASVPTSATTKPSEVTTVKNDIASANITSMGFPTSSPGSVGWDAKTFVDALNAYSTCSSPTSPQALLYSGVCQYNDHYVMGTGNYDASNYWDSGATNTLVCPGGSFAHCDISTPADDTTYCCLNLTDVTESVFNGRYDTPFRTAVFSTYTSAYNASVVAKDMYDLKVTMTSDINAVDTGFNDFVAGVEYVQSTIFGFKFSVITIVQQASYLVNFNCSVPASDDYFKVKGAICGKIVPNLLLTVMSVGCASLAGIAAIILQVVLSKRMKFDPNAGGLNGIQMHYMEGYGYKNKK